MSTVRSEKVIRWTACDYLDRLSRLCFVIWFAVVFYLLLSPVVCLLIGRAIRMRDAERPVEQCPADAEAPAPAEIQTDARTVEVEPEVPVAV